MKTYGYDYAYAITIHEINAALTRNLSSLDVQINYHTVDPDSGSTITLSSVLAPWQVVTGGQNSLINVEIPFSQGVMSLEGGALTGSYDLSGVSVVVQMQLGWLGPGSPQQAQGQAGATQLIFDPSETSDPNDPGYVAAIAIKDPDSQLDTVSTALLKAYVAAALVDNKSKVQYVFANINPKPLNLASWLQPTRWIYHYAQTASVDALCFLCMMSDQALPAPAFDSQALPSGTDCAILISQPQFFAHVVLPGVQAAFPGGHFVQTNTDDTSAITNAGDFDVGSLSASSLMVKASAQGNGLQVSASGGGPLKFLFGLASLPDASYSWSISSNNPLVYANGQVSFSNDPNPVITQDHDIKWYDWALLVVTGITNVAGLVAAIYDAVNNFHDDFANAGVSTINTEVQQATGHAVVNLQNIVDWRLGASPLTIQSTSLAGALYAQGQFS